MTREWDIEALDARRLADAIKYAELDLVRWKERPGADTDLHLQVIADIERNLAKLRSTGLNPADWIRGPDCVDRHLYAIRSRNLAFGVYKEAEAGFVGIREKLGSEFLFTEYHADLYSPTATVYPYVDLGECPIEDLSEYLRFWGSLITNTTLFNWLNEREAALDWHALMGIEAR